MQQTAPGPYAFGYLYGIQHFQVEQSLDLVQFVSMKAGLDEESALRLLQFGAVYVQGLRRTTNNPVTAGEIVRIHTRPRRFRAENWNPSEHILFENSQVLIVDKPSGLPSHPTVDNLSENVLSFCGRALGLELHITHRLDVVSEGILVLAKNKDAQKQVNFDFSLKRFEKTYIALHEGNPLPKQILRHWMQPSERSPKKVVEAEQEGHQLCELEVLTSQAFDGGFSRTEMRLLTGRTHQIRCQLGHVGRPILADTLYGARDLSQDSRIALRHSHLAGPAPWMPPEGFVVSNLPAPEGAWASLCKIEK